MAGSSSPGRVFVLAGHRIDAADRPAPRFPPEAVPAVAARLAELLARLDAGPADLALTQGAGGADLLAAEAALVRRVPLQLMLPLPEADFVARSVRGGGGADAQPWLRRWQAVRAAARAVQTLPAEGREAVPWARANGWLLEAALQAAGTPAALHLVCVWDGRDGDGPGGTGDLVERVRAAGGTVHRLDPSP